MTDSFDDSWKCLKERIDRLNEGFQLNSDPHPSELMCALLIVGEDHRFDFHPGFDPIAICRAALRTGIYGRSEGGSTIAMQLVRTVTGRYERTIRRKFQEIRLACALTKYVPRERIPSMYLRIAYYGWRMNNFVQACDRLNIDPRSTTLVEAAELIARLKYPQPRSISERRAKQIRNRSQYIVRRFQRARNKGKFILAPKNGTIQSYTIAGQNN